MSCLTYVYASLQIFMESCIGCCRAKRAGNDCLDFSTRSGAKLLDIVIIRITAVHYITGNPEINFKTIPVWYTNNHDASVILSCACKACRFLYKYIHVQLPDPIPGQPLPIHMQFYLQAGSILIPKVLYIPDNPSTLFFSNFY